MDMFVYSSTSYILPTCCSDFMCWGHHIQGHQGDRGKARRVFERRWGGWGTWTSRHPIRHCHGVRRMGCFIVDNDYYHFGAKYIRRDIEKSAHMHIHFYILICAFKSSIRPLVVP